MRLLQFAQVVTLCLLVSLSDARRIRVQRVRPIAEDDTISGSLTGLEDQDGDSQQVRYYAAQQPEDARVDARAGRVVLLSAADASTLNGLYNRAITSRGGTDSIVSRAQAVKDHTKAPPVQTIRNYSKVNDDGSFTFGYEAADGSFKEETRGTDCVVRGKYGYVDPDGNKREFTYVSGNPCDPNAVNQEEPNRDDDPAGASSAEEPAGPANYPSRRPTEARTLPTRPSTTLFQQSYNQATDEEEDSAEERAAAIAAARARAAAAAARATAATAAAARATAATPTALPTPSRSRQSTPAAVRITPRPYSIPTTAEPPATTFRPVHVTVSSRPALYSKQTLPEARPSPGTVDFAEELRKFQLENNVVLTTERSFPSSASPSPSPSTLSRPVKPSSLGSDPIYTTELVYDPASGQYNTVVYQAVPKAQDISAQVQRQRLQPYVAQAVPAAVAAPPPPAYQQQLVRQQQATLLQQSQQLFAQQQRQLQQQQQQLSRPSYHPLQYQQLQSVSSTAPPVKIAPAPSSPAPARYVPQVQYASAAPSRPTSPFYYVSPQDAGDQRASLASGQIDAFLRGHNLTF